jgi:flagellar biosynthesis protein FlhB
MADERPDGQERTEKPTQRRLQQAREQGQVARSQELSAAAVMLTGAAALAMVAGPSLSRFAGGTLRESARALAGDPMTAAGGIGMLRHLTMGFVFALLPFAIGVMAVVTLVNVVQTRGSISFQPLAPKLDRISPAAGIKRLMSLDSVVTLIKALIKLAVLGAVTWLVLNGSFPQLMALTDNGPADTSAVLRSLAFRLAILTGLAFLVVALADYLFQVFRFEQKLKMSRQEIVRENRETEGDPLVKARILSIMRAKARQRMMRQVPTADVVVVNPTEIAVALKYDPSQSGAPMVVAMGRRKLAERIRAIATKAGVPIVENRPVARALIATAAVGRPIPPALYAAVAEILAFVYRRRGTFPTGLSSPARSSA